MVVSELLHTRWTDYIVLLEREFPALQVNVFSAPQEDAHRMLFEGSAQLALMFEREQLETREQFIELKREVLVAVAAKQHPLSQFHQVSYEQILQNRQIVVASRDRSIKPELLFSRNYWRTDNHHSACSMIQQGLGWGVLPLEMINEQPHLQEQLQILHLLDFTQNLNILSIWSGAGKLDWVQLLIFD